MRATFDSNEANSRRNMLACSQVEELAHAVKQAPNRAELSSLVADPRWGVVLAAATVPLPSGPHRYPVLIRMPWQARSQDLKATDNESESACHR